MTVSSALPFVPMTITPSYCATKAAIHSYTPIAALSAQGDLGSGPGVDPSLCTNSIDGSEAGKRPNAMPLDEFIAETMKILKDSPEATEICVETGQAAAVRRA